MENIDTQNGNKDTLPYVKDTQFKNFLQKVIGEAIQRIADKNIVTNLPPRNKRDNELRDKDAH